MTTTPLADSVLDHAVWASLTGAHAHLAEGGARVLRYPARVSPFLAVAPDAGADFWAEIVDLVGPGQTIGLSGLGPGVLEARPPGWVVAGAGAGVQLVATDRVVGEPFGEAVELGAADAPEMVDLVARTQPGPFEPETYRLGRYLGVRREGRLVALAGERLHPPGYTEISAVCTDPDHRRQGLARRLVLALAHGIRERGETPIMHAAAVNVEAVAIYRALGFELRRSVEFVALTTPPASQKP